MPAAVAILIANYRTPQLTPLCLELIRRHTAPGMARVIVVDNDSRDASVDHLRSLEWIELIERPGAGDDTPSLSHCRAMDIALERVADEPYVLAFHTDTLVLRDGWLEFLLGEIERDGNIAGVGSWKLERKPLHRRAAKRVEAAAQSAWYGLRGRDRSGLEGTAHHRQFLRSHCALYRTGLLRRYGLTFSGGGDTAGKVIHERLVAAGHEMIFLPSETLGRYLVHLNHATMVLNPELGIAQRSALKGERRIRRMVEKLQAQAMGNGQ